MNIELAYINNNLSLSIIATHLKEQPYMITRAIRWGYKDSFYNYINGLRVRKFLEELPKPENELFTIDTLSTKCGFNSSATLHKYFKALTGITPAIAQKKLKSGVEKIETLMQKHTDNQNVETLFRK